MGRAAAVAGAAHGGSTALDLSRKPPGSTALPRQTDPAAQRQSHGGISHAKL